MVPILKQQETQDGIEAPPILGKIDKNLFHFY